MASRLTANYQGQSRLSFYGSGSSGSRLQRSTTTTKNRVPTKKRLWQVRWQIVGLWLLIVASVLIYLVWVFPALVSWTGELNSAKYIAPESNVRPQMPLFNAPPTDTNVASVKMSGFGTPGSKVQLVVNGDARPQYLVEVGINGEFALMVDLDEGENTIQAYSYDDRGLESKVTKKYSVNLDTKIPEIDLQAPENGQEFMGTGVQTITIHGQTEPGAKVVVNNTAGRANSEGIFDINYRLTDGNNILEVVATDAAENEAHVTIQVRYSQ
ncbi:hypothetical protein IJJ27_02610 [bacterium]|nr:hypothetical protein [bacterium]